MSARQMKSWPTQSRRSNVMSVMYVCICQVEEEQRANARLRQEQGIEWQPKVHMYHIHY